MSIETRADTPSWWSYAKPLLIPLLIWLLLATTLAGPVLDWLDSEQRHDQGAIQEWIEEARNADWTLAELVAAYRRQIHHYAQLTEAIGDNPEEATRLLFALEDTKQSVAVKREEIYQHLRSLGEPPTKIYSGQLPLFPQIYRLEVHLPPMPEAVVLEGLPPVAEPIVWDSGIQPGSSQYRQLEVSLGQGSRVRIHYQLRAWNKRQQAEQQRFWRLRLLVVLTGVATVLGVSWVAFGLAEQREQQRQRELARQQLDRAERERLDEERRRIEMERQLLDQRMAAEKAQRVALELKSQLYASIGIMAGSYAHNIKNLLVRPNDLLRRCLERPGISSEEERMLREVQQTLGLVTERLQQILQTVRRDPSACQPRPLDLGKLLRSLVATWGQLAAERWKLDLVLQVADEPLAIEGDESHLLQAIENLLFNARDATFERRTQLREAARHDTTLPTEARRQAVLTAAAWRGRAVLRAYRRLEPTRHWVVLEVTDNGVGMTEEIRQQCTQPHFTTKRDNALYQGHSTGMGLGLSFVLAILDHHRATLEIESQPGQGTTLRAVFPAQRLEGGGGSMEGERNTSSSLATPHPPSVTGIVGPDPIDEK